MDDDDGGDDEMSSAATRNPHEDFHETLFLPNKSSLSTPSMLNDE